MDSKAIIFALGGPTEVARICGDITPQAVSQWYGTDSDGRERTIPKPWLLFLKATHPDVFKQPKPPKGAGRAAPASLSN